MLIIIIQPLIILIAYINYNLNTIITQAHTDKTNHEIIYFLIDKTVTDKDNNIVLSS